MGSAFEAEALETQIIGNLWAMAILWSFFGRHDYYCLVVVVVVVCERGSKRDDGVS